MSTGVPAVMVIDELTPHEADEYVSVCEEDGAIPLQSRYSVMVTWYSLGPTQS